MANTLKDLAATAVVGLAGGLVVYCFLSGSPRAINFPQKNAKIVSFSLPTRGSVTSIDRSMSSSIDSTISQDGSVTYNGNLRYCIKQGSGVEGGQVDYEKNPEYGKGNDFWCDTRYGTVKVKGDKK
jgi:hypothetical protein